MEGLDEFVDHLRGQGTSDHTIRAYRGDVAAFAAWMRLRTGVPFDPAAVVAIDVADYRRALAPALAPATVNRKLAALRTFFRWARQQGLATYDPAEDVRGISTQANRAPKAISRTEQAALVRAAQHTGRPAREVLARSLLVLLLQTGLRIQELCSLRGGHLDLGERKGAITVLGKDLKQRLVPCNADARAALRVYFDLRGVPGPEASGPGEFHPGALTEPDVSLSTHPAPPISPSV